MKRGLKNTIRFLSNAFPLHTIEGKKLPPKIVLYHAIENNQPFYIKGYRVKTIAEFKKDLDFLLKKYKPVEFDEITKQPFNNKLIHFSFDDGLKSCYTNIAPILKQKGIPASFFINPAFVDNKEIYHRFEYEYIKQFISNLNPKYISYKYSKELYELAKENEIDIKNLAQEQTPYMSLDEIKILQDDGFLIGGHSMDHPEFYEISDEEQYNQIESSMEWIQNHINPKLKVFAFPYTDDGIKNSLLQKVRKNNLVDFTLGTAGLKYDVSSNHFQRIPMEPFNLSSARQIFKYEHLYFKLRAIVGKNTVTRK
jgi:peptidoglycan/xylan/chitin deacetylase (PgdA/CDA1 family)